MKRIRIRIGKDGQTTFAVEGVREEAETVASRENIPDLACGKLTKALEEAVGQVVERRVCLGEAGDEPAVVTEQPRETV
jgi:hypothetical protein